MSGEQEQKDWFARLEEELGKKEKQVMKDSSMTTGKKAEINKKILTDLWLTWVRFNKHYMTRQLKRQN